MFKKKTRLWGWNANTTGCYSFPPLPSHSGHVISNRNDVCFHTYFYLGRCGVPGFAWLSVNVQPCRADSSFACLTLSGSKHPTPSGKPLYSKLWKCIFPSRTAKQGGLNALKRALFFFKNSTKLILLPYKAVDFAINDRYFINRREFSTRARNKN